MISTDRRALASALLAIALAQACYWWILAPLLFSQPPIRNTIDVGRIQVATVTEPRLELVASAPRETIEIGDHQCCGPGYRAFVLEVALPRVPADGLAYVSGFGADNIAVYVNGTMLRRDGRMELPAITYHNNLRRILHIPSGLLRQGDNEIVNIVVRDYIPWFDVGRPLLGPYTALRSDLAGRSFMLNEYKIISATTGIVLAVMALLVCLRAEQRRLGLWMALLLAAWTLRTLYYNWAESPLHGRERLLYYFTVTAALPFAWTNTINEWTGRPWPWLRRASALMFALSLVAIAYALYTSKPDGYDAAAAVTNILGISCAVAGLACLVFHLLRAPSDRAWERAVLLLCISLVATEYAQELLFDRTAGQSQTSLPLLMIVFAIAFARGNAQLLRLAHQFNDTLANRLALRERELSESHRRETELVRRETLAGERRRLMLDMHDGVVGQLVGLQHAARKGTLDSIELADGIADAIEELRVMIDSLDGAGANLSNALASFRSRIEPRLSAIGIQMTWRNELPLDAAACEPETVLQVLRILQEAVTNAIKHAKTARLEIACWPSGEQGPKINLSVRDYGTGIRPQSRHGRGLANMRERASAIGAQLSIAVDEPGTALLLELPRG